METNELLKIRPCHQWEGYSTKKSPVCLTRTGLSHMNYEHREVHWPHRNTKDAEPSSDAHTKPQNSASCKHQIDVCSFFMPRHQGCADFDMSNRRKKNRKTRGYRGIPWRTIPEPMLVKIIKAEGSTVEEQGLAESELEFRCRMRSI